MNYDLYKHHQEQADKWWEEYERVEDTTENFKNVGEQFKDSEDEEIPDLDIINNYILLCKRNYEEHRRLALKAYKATPKAKINQRTLLN